MQVQRFWKIVAIGGLIINITLVAAILLQSPFKKHPNHYGPGGPKNYIIEYLKLSEEQIAKYDIMVDNDRHFVFQSEKEIRNFRRKLYSKDLDSFQINTCLDSMSILTRGIEKQRIFHIQEIKSLCETNEQKELFKQLALELPELFSPRKGSRSDIPQNKKTH